MKKTLLSLVLIVMAGCSYYQPKTDIEQPLDWGGFNNPHNFAKIYPFEETLSSQEVEAMIADNRDATCSFLTFSALWDYYNSHWTRSHKQTQRIIDASTCTLSHPFAYWMGALLDEDKGNWNKGLVLLNPLFENPQQNFYIPALGLSHRLQSARKTSIHDLSPDEIQKIMRQKETLVSLQSLGPPSDKSIQHVVLLYDKSLLPGFFKSFLEAVEEQSQLVSCHFFSADSPREDIIAALSQPRTLLIGYHLAEPIPKSFLLEATTSITVGYQFEKNRQVDYWIADRVTQIVQSFESGPIPLAPQAVLYEPTAMTPKLYRLLGSKKTINLETLGVTSTLAQLMNLPQRSAQFKRILSSDTLYIPQPRSFPHSILCICSAQSLHQINSTLTKWGLNKTLLMSDQSVISGNPEVDKLLKGVLISTHPFDKAPRHQEEGAIAADLIAIALRLHRFQEEPNYVYHGHRGAYHLNDQQISYQRWWTRYKEK